MAEKKLPKRQNKKHDVQKSQGSRPAEDANDKNAGPVRDSQNKPVDPPRPGFPIVGIGSSAGGLEALEHFFKAMPSDANIGFVIVAHLDSKHVSILPELLQKRTGMPVQQAKDGARIQPNHVYVIPPNKDLSILHGSLCLTDLLASRGTKLPIDSFFRSLAQDQEGKAIGLVLSGTGSDGTLGARHIKGAAGLIMVQEAGSAKYDGMPRSVISAGLADYVLPPEQMPEQLLKYVERTNDPSVAKIEPDQADKYHKRPVNRYVNCANRSARGDGLA